MISGQKSPSNKKKLFSINRQIYEKISSKKKLNLQHNSKSKINSLYITPTKLQKYTELYSKYKLYSKGSTQHDTHTPIKSKSIFRPSSSLYKFKGISSIKKYPPLISNFNNSSSINFLYPRTPNKKSRNIHYQFYKNATMEKRNNFDKLYPNINNSNSLSSQLLMHNTMKNLNYSYKKFFLNKKKINITSINKTKNNNKNTKNKIEKNKNSSNYNVKSNKFVRLKKYKISINDEELFNKNINNINNGSIKSIIDLKLIQNRIQNGLDNNSNNISEKKKINNDEFSFNRDYFEENYNIVNDEIKKCENINEDIINFVNVKINDKNNLIQSKIIANISEMEINKKIYDENYECDTPQFTTIDEQKLK